MSNKPEHAEFVERWRRAGPALEIIRLQELRHFRHEDHIAEIEALLDLGARLAPPRFTSGLVEQQRLFRNAQQ